MRFTRILPLLLLFMMADGWAQTAIPNTTPVTQNFNSMNATTTLPSNWRMGTQTATPTWGGATATLSAQASGGTPSAGGTYNWGTTAGTDRAAGVMTSGSYASPNSLIGFYQNTNAGFLTDLAITYNLERYRINTAAASVQFFYSLDGTNWTAVTAGDVAAASIPTGASSYTFGTPLSVPVSFSITGLTIANLGNIYLRWNLNTTGSNSQGIGIDDVSVTATFASGCSTPSTQASAIGVNTITNTGASFTWANGAATSGTMVVINPTASASAAPTSGTGYTANAAWASAGQINANNRVIYRSNGTAASVTGLTPATQYTATIYAYNDPGSCYNTVAPETITFYTLANEPTAHPAAGAFTCSTVSVSQINLSFPAANTVGSNANGYIIMYRIGAAPTGVPTDGAYHAPGTVFGDATVLGYTGVGGTDTSFSATGLNAGTTYYFSLIPFGSFLSVPETMNYRTAATIRTTNCTTVTSPEINITGAGQTINPGNTPIFLDNTLFAAQTVSTTSAPKSFVIQNLGNANLVLTGSTPYVTLGGANPGDFAISTPATSPIAASSSSTFAITFTPTATGVRTATVTVGSNDSTEPTYTFNIQGSGDDREIEVYGKGQSIPSGSATASAANDTHFGNVNIAAGTSVRNFSVFNTGGLSLTISGVTITGPNAADFSVTATPASPLAQNVSTVLSITFDPSTVGIKNATVTINNDDTNESAYTFAIQGNGIDYTDCGLGAYEVIGQQDFEAAPAAPVMNYSYTQESGAGIVTVGGGTARGSSRTVSSNMFVGARSFQVAGHNGTSTTEKLTTVDFSSVDASAFTDVSMSFKLGAYSTNSTQGLDTSPEKITVYLSTNNGASWSQEMDIYGNSNSIWDINTSTGSATGNFDGNNITTVYTTTMTGVNVGPRTITLNNLPSSAQLKVRITMSLDRLDEIWVIDDVKFQGRKNAETIWNGSSWSNGAPTTSVKAIINGPYNTAANGNIQTCRCQVNAGFTLTVGANTFLEIQDNLLNSGTVNVASSGSLVQVNNYAANTGNITVGRDVNMRKYDYVYWSAPVANFAVTAVSPGTASNYIYKWQPTQGGSYGIWVGTGENMVPGRGYIIRGASSWTTTFSLYSASFAGAPNNGVITPSIERGSYTGGNYANPNGVIVTNQDDNWNLIGNPYPSSIRALDFLNANTNIEGAVRLWTHGSLPSAAVTDPFYGNFLYNYNSNDYIVYNGTGTVSGPAGFNGYIASGQGFFVQMNDGPASTQTVTFNNSMRNRTYGNAQFYRPVSTAGNRTEKTMGESSRIWLDLIGSDQMVSRTLIGYVDGATLEKDRLFDAYGKRDNSLNFYSLIGEDALAIQGRPLPFDQNDIVPLGLHVASAGNYKIAVAAIDGLFESNQVAIYLEDKTLGVVHDLRQSPYEFAAATGILDNRFLLRYAGQALGTDGFNATDFQLLVAVSDHQIKIKSTTEPIREIAVYDLLGRTVFSAENAGSREFSIPEMSMRQQAVMVKVTLENGKQFTRKVLL